MHRFASGFPPAPGREGHHGCFVRLRARAGPARLLTDKKGRGLGMPIPKRVWAAAHSRSD